MRAPTARPTRREHVAPPPWRLGLTCPQCAGDVDLVNTTANGLLSVAIVACQPCRAQWEVSVRIRRHRLDGIDTAPL